MADKKERRFFWCKFLLLWSRRAGSKKVLKERSAFAQVVVTANALTALVSLNAEVKHTCPMLLQILRASTCKYFVVSNASICSKIKTNMDTAFPTPPDPEARSGTVSLSATTAHDTEHPRNFGLLGQRQKDGGPGSDLLHVVISTKSVVMCPRDGGTRPVRRAQKMSPTLSRVDRILVNLLLEELPMYAYYSRRKSSLPTSAPVIILNHTFAITMIESATSAGPLRA
jgi:hypothetical protein